MEEAKAVVSLGRRAIDALGRAAGVMGEGMRAKDDASTREAHLAGSSGWPERTDRCPARGQSGAGWESDRPKVPENSEKDRGREGALVQGKRTKEREYGDWR